MHGLVFEGAAWYWLTKEPYIPTKEPYIPTKEPCVPTKEPHIPAKEPHIRTISIMRPNSPFPYYVLAKNALKKNTLKTHLIQN